MPEKCDRKGASPTESAAGQDWAKGTLRSWYTEAAFADGDWRQLIVGISVGIRYVQRVEEDPVSAAPHTRGRHDPGVLNAGGTAGILIWTKGQASKQRADASVCVCARLLWEGNDSRPGIQ